METAFKTIGIIGKFGVPDIGEPLLALFLYLKEKGFRILLDSGSTQPLQNHMEADFVNREEMGNACDLIFVMGGDGTFLNAVRSLYAYSVPFVGVNLGRLGFLTDISPGDFSTLDEIFSGNYQEDERIILKAHVDRHGEQFGHSGAFNDVTIHKWETARMIEFDTFVNKTFVLSQRADGCIVSTPTGSTAYALSCGGPLLHPALNALSIVAICPHTLTNRPMVFDGDSEIEFQIPEFAKMQARITFDGQNSLDLLPGDKVFIRRDKLPVRLIHPSRHNHFNILRAKLGANYKASA
jgi:NAD+ kinase